MWNTSNHKNSLPWGRNMCPRVLDIMFGNENFEKVSSNWGQLILFNKMIMHASFEYLIGIFFIMVILLGIQIVVLI